MTEASAREELLQHAKSRRNGVFPESFTHRHALVNPLCGDQVELRAFWEGEVLRALGFSAQACAICTASASLLSEQAPGWTRDQFLARREAFEHAVTDAPEQAWPEEIAAFQSFAHLRVNPRRRACAILPWLALARAL